MRSELFELCRLNGVSGDEDRVREYIRQKAAPYADSMRTDAVGNLSRLSNGQVDAAIAAAQSGGRAPLEALDRLLWQVCPAVPLTNPARYYGFRHDSSVRVMNVEVRPFGGGRWGSPLSRGAERPSRFPCWLRIWWKS